MQTDSNTRNQTWRETLSDESQFFLDHTLIGLFDRLYELRTKQNMSNIRSDWSAKDKSP